MGLDLTGEFTTKVNFDPSEEGQSVETPQYSHTFAINDCVPAFTDEDGVEYPEMSVVYGYQLQFSSYDDLIAFENNPEFQQIIRTISQTVSERLNDPEEGSGAISTLQLEATRDDNPYYINNEDSGPDTFTEGTMNDIGVITEDIIPIINQTYDLNIKSGAVLKDSSMSPGSCVPPYVGPNDHASLDEDGGQKLGGGSNGSTDFTM